MNLRFIITGAPGTGKSTLLRYLADQGVDVVPEPARQILAEHKGLAQERFTQLMLEKAISSWKDGDSHQGPLVFDRGIADNIVYARHFQLDEKPYWEAARQYAYHPKVFVCPLWESIYTKDAERTMNFAATIPFQESLLAVYRELDYQLIELPKLPAADRAQFFMERAY